MVTLKEAEYALKTVYLAGVKQMLDDKQTYKAKSSPHVDGLIPTRHTVTRTAPKIGRNDKCPCGSGNKYKHCCGGGL